MVGELVADQVLGQVQIYRLFLLQALDTQHD